MSAAERQVEDCAFYMKGSCTKGRMCPFRHNPAAARTREVCPIWARYQWCSGMCGKQHPTNPLAPVMVEVPAMMPVSARPPAPPCRFFAAGKCTKGASCPFFHDEVSGSSPPQPTSLREAAERGLTEAPMSSESGIHDPEAAGRAAAIMQKHSLSVMAAAKGVVAERRKVVDKTPASVAQRQDKVGNGHEALNGSRQEDAAPRKRSTASEEEAKEEGGVVVFPDEETSPPPDKKRHIM